jgi:hypothetical protein
MNAMMMMIVVRGTESEKTHRKNAEKCTKNTQYHPLLIDRNVHVWIKVFAECILISNLSLIVMVLVFGKKFWNNFDVFRIYDVMMKVIGNENILLFIF